MAVWKEHRFMKPAADGEPTCQFPYKDGRRCRYPQSFEIGWYRGEFAPYGESSVTFDEAPRVCSMLYKRYPWPRIVRAI